MSESLYWPENTVYAQISLYLCAIWFEYDIREWKFVQLTMVTWPEVCMICQFKWYKNISLNYDFVIKFYFNTSVRAVSKLTLFGQMEFPIKSDTVKSRGSIVYIEGS